MQLPKSQFISFKKATSIIQNCDLEDLEYFVQQGALAIFAPTPTYFPTNNIFSDEERIFESFYAIAMFFNEPLSDRCRIKLPFSHHNGSVTCGAIVVTDISGNVPTTKKDITLSKTDGCIGPDGEIRLLSRTWSFSEDDLLLSREELKQYEDTVDEDPHKSKGTKDGIGHEYISNFMSEAGRKGGRKTKKNQPILEAVKRFIQENPKITNMTNNLIARKFYKEFRVDSFMSVVVNNEKYEVFSQGELVISRQGERYDGERGNNKEKSIKKSTFEARYIQEAKNRLSTPELQ